jgi:hypothetical protein
MDYSNFDLLFASAPELYAASLSVCALAYFLILRKRIHSFFDPLFFNMVFTICAAAVVPFLYFAQDIRGSYFAQFLVTELLFLFCMVAIPEPRATLRLSDQALISPSRRRFLQCLYLISAGVFVVSQLSAYAIGGIPLFHDSRLDYYSGGGGFGSLGRAVSMSSFFCWYLLIYRFVYQWRIGLWPKACDFGILLVLLTSAVLSGSRSTFVSVLFLIFYFRLIHKRTPLYPKQQDARLAKGQFITLIVASVGALLVLSATSYASGVGGAIYAFLFRMVMSGDVYFMAYPNDLLKSLNGGNPLLALFGGSLIAFRLIPPDMVPEPLGFQLFHSATGMSGMFGPNPRHNVFGLVYFGCWGSIIYSAFLGALVGVVRNVGFRFVRIGGLSELIYVFAAVSVVSLNTSGDAFIGDMTNLVLIGCPMVAIAYIASHALAIKIDHPQDEQLSSPTS